MLKSIIRCGNYSHERKICFTLYIRTGPESKTIYEDAQAEGNRYSAAISRMAAMRSLR